MVTSVFYKTYIGAPITTALIEDFTTELKCRKGFISLFHKRFLLILFQKTNHGKYHPWLVFCIFISKKGDGSPVHNSKNIIPSLFVLKKYKYGIYIQNFIN